MQIVYNVAMITINETLVVQLISFLVFMFIINRVMFRPLQLTIDERGTHIRTLQLEIEQSKREIEMVTDEIRSQEAIARSEAMELSRETEGMGTRESAETIAATREEIMVRIGEARTAIDEQVADAVEAIRSESESLADRILEQLLDRELS